MERQIENKEMFKQAIFEVLQDQEEWFCDLLTEVIEDLGLLNAIKEGEFSEEISREEVFKILDGKE